MQKLDLQQKGVVGRGGGRYTILGALDLPPRETPDEKTTIKVLLFIYFIFYFSHGDISTVGLKSSRFEFRRWARLDRAVRPKLLVTFISEKQ